MRQDDLFSVGKPAPVLQPEIPHPDTVRTRLRAALAEVQAAGTMPWEPARARTEAMVFHNMANWLPEEERDALRSAFAAELDRLRRAPSGA